MRLVIKIERKMLKNFNCVLCRRMLSLKNNLKQQLVQEV